MNLTIHFSSGKIILSNQLGSANITIPPAQGDYSLSKDLILFDLNKNQPEKKIYIENPESFKALLDQSVRWIEAAGGYVVNPAGEILLIFRRGKWDLPKGKLDEGENPQEAAIREVEEECGVQKLTITKKLIDTYHCYQQNNLFILKKTHWFVMTTNFKGKLIPQSEEGINKAEWRNPELLANIQNNTYPSIQEVLDAGKTIKL